VLAKTGEELLNICNDKGISLSEYAILYEMESSELTREEVIKMMEKSYDVMLEACRQGMEEEVFSVSGLIGGDGYKINKYLNSGKSLTGNVIIKAMARAMSCAEVNASMGKIVACPTAGSCGILPAVIITAVEQLEIDYEAAIKGLFAASALGIIIAQNATLAGAEGGCQAECGSASAMGAAAVVEMMGGTPEMSLNAAAIVFKNIMGLVCDPVAGLVEVPCAKRNVAGAVSALSTADLVMAGVNSKIPFDDVLSAMYDVGKNMPSELKETAMGGIAITKTGLKLKEQVFGK
jgi:L-serine dehydratase